MWQSMDDINQLAESFRGAGLACLSGLLSSSITLQHERRLWCNMLLGEVPVKSQVSLLLYLVEQHQLLCTSILKALVDNGPSQTCPLIDSLSCCLQLHDAAPAGRQTHPQAAPAQLGRKPLSAASTALWAPLPHPPMPRSSCQAPPCRQGLGVEFCLVPMRGPCQGRAAKPLHQVGGPAAYGSLPAPRCRSRRCCSSRSRSTVLTRRSGGTHLAACSTVWLQPWRRLRRPVACCQNPHLQPPAGDPSHALPSATPEAPCWQLQSRPFLALKSEKLLPVLNVVAIHVLPVKMLQHKPCLAGFVGCSCCGRSLLGHRLF